MRRLLLWALLCGSLSSALSAFTIKDAYPRYIDEEQLLTLSEYLTGSEGRSGSRVLHSQEERTGEYFVIRLDRSVKALPDSSTAVVEVVTSLSKEPVTYTFPLDGVRGGSRELMLGVTGSDWPGKDAKPVAWKITLRNGDFTLSEWKSFLWEMP